MVPDTLGKKYAVKCLDATEAREVMGVWQTPLGTMDTQLVVLENQIQEWINMLKNGYLPRHVIWRAFWGTLWMSIHYVLPAINITKKTDHKTPHPR